MALVDEKGRIFGKLNIIDILAVILVIAAGVFLVGKVLENRGGGEMPTMNLTYTVKVYNVDAEVYRSIQQVKLPDQLMASGEMLSGRVIDVDAEAAGGGVFEFIPDEEGKLEIRQSVNEAYDLTFIIEAYISNRVTSEIGTQEIRVGKDHIVKTANFEFEHGVILSCEWSDAAA